MYNISEYLMISVTLINISDSVPLALYPCSLSQHFISLSKKKKKIFDVMVDKVCQNITKLTMMQGKCNSCCARHNGGIVKHTSFLQRCNIIT